MEKTGHTSEAILTIIRSNNRAQAVLHIMFHIYYEREYIQFLVSKLNELQQPESSEDSNKEFTTAQQVLAFHFVMKRFGILNKVNKTEIAELIRFLTRKEIGVKKINNTTIYKRLKKPYPLNDKQLKSDLRFIRDYFKKRGFRAVANEIDEELRSIE